MVSDELIKKYLGDDTVDPVRQILDVINTKSQFNASDNGIYHPDNSSNVKIDKNGVLNIMTPENNGIRLDPGTNSIMEFTLNKKQQIGTSTSWVEKYIKFFIKQYFYIEAQKIESISKKINRMSQDINIRANSFEIKTDPSNIKLGGFSVRYLHDIIEEYRAYLESNLEENNSNLKLLIEDIREDLQGKINNINTTINNMQTQINNINNSLQSLWSAFSSHSH